VSAPRWFKANEKQVMETLEPSTARAVIQQLKEALERLPCDRASRCDHEPHEFGDACGCEDYCCCACHYARQHAALTTASAWLAEHPEEA